MRETPIIETLATGDEVVSGDVVDSNSAFVSVRLTRLGLPISRHGALPDDIGALEAGIREIAGRADLCICSGGLGPTDDDLTADVIAKIAGVPIDIDGVAITRMKERFAKLNYRFSENNLRSGRVPRGATVFQNEVGTAPAFSIRIGRCEVFCLPGVPREFQFFVNEHILPWAGKRWPSGTSATIQLKTLGWGESHLAEKFQDFAGLFPDVKIGYRAHNPEVWIKFTAKADSREAALLRLAPVVSAAKARIGSTIFGEGDDELPRMVHLALEKSGRTFATAESCTGGQIAQLITSNPGSSSYFQGGAVVYSNTLKSRILGVPEKTLAEHDAVSAAVAEALARGALERLGSDMAVSTTGIAGPGGEAAGKPVGTVFIGIAWRNGSDVESRVILRRFRGDRERVQKAASYTALEIVRRKLLDAEPLPDGLSGD